MTTMMMMTMIYSIGDAITKTELICDLAFLSRPIHTNIHSLVSDHGLCRIILFVFGRISYDKLLTEQPIRVKVWPHKCTICYHL